MIVSVQAGVVDISWIVCRFLGLLVAGWFLFHLVIPVRFLGRLEDRLGCLKSLGIIAFFKKVVPFLYSWDIGNNHLTNCLTLAQLTCRSVDKRETFVNNFQMVDPV